jgi:beta-lactamase superfamily II metal-dependent hydrolase
MAQAKPKGLIEQMTDTARAQASGGSFGAPLGSGGSTVAAAPARVPLVVMYHLDTNQGDATIIIGSGLCVFVDCSFGWVAERMCAIATKLGCARADVFTISHFDKDHFYGMGTVLASMRPGVVLSPAVPASLDSASHLQTCKLYDQSLDSPDADLLKIVRQLFDRNHTKGVRSCLSSSCQKAEGSPFTVRTPSQQGALNLGGGVVMTPVYNADGRDLATIRDNNDSSVAWVLSAANVNYYTAGDLEAGEQALAKGLTVRLHIVKCGHHGSEASTSEPFLKKAMPTVAILQGSSAMYPHPTEAVLVRLKAAGANVFSTGFYVSFEPKPTVCGGSTFAGDAVATIWNDGVFSMYWMGDDGSPRCSAWDGKGAQVKLGNPEQQALLGHIPLASLAKLDQSHNLGLAAAKLKHEQIAKEGGKKKKGDGKKKTAASAAASADDRSYCEPCLKKGVQVPCDFSCEICGATVCVAHRPKGEKFCLECAY